MSTQRSIERSFRMKIVGIGQVDFLDSLTLEVEFDDFLDQTTELIGVSASLGPDSLGPPQVSTIMHQRDYAERLRAIRDSSYVADSIQFVEDQEPFYQFYNLLILIKNLHYNKE